MNIIILRSPLCEVARIVVFSAHLPNKCSSLCLTAYAEKYQIAYFIKCEPPFVVCYKVLQVTWKCHDSQKLRKIKRNMKSKVI